jgi:hypothetical protein
MDLWMKIFRCSSRRSLWALSSCLLMSVVVCPGVMLVALAPVRPGSRGGLDCCLCSRSVTGCE